MMPTACRGISSGSGGAGGKGAGEHYQDPEGRRVTTSPANRERKEARHQSPCACAGASLPGVGHNPIGEQDNQRAELSEGRERGRDDTGRGGHVLGWSQAVLGGGQGTPGLPSGQEQLTVAALNSFFRKTQNTKS